MNGCENDPTFCAAKTEEGCTARSSGKLEENMYTRLEGEQQKLYDAHVKRMKLLLDKQSEEEFNTSKIVILSELTKLRQICCDPALLLKNIKESRQNLRCVWI